MSSQMRIRICLSISEYAGLEPTHVFQICQSGRNSFDSHEGTIWTTRLNTKKGVLNFFFFLSSLFPSGKCRPLMT